MTQTRTAQQIADAIEANTQAYYDDEITLDTFKLLNVKYWREAKANGTQEQVRDILFVRKVVLFPSNNACFSHTDEADNHLCDMEMDADTYENSDVVQNAVSAQGWAQDAVDSE